MAAEIDASASVNISRFANKLIGIGGFINISQNAKKMVFGGTFTAGGLHVACDEGQLRIVQEGAHQKFVATLQQGSYSGPYASQRGQTVLFVTERAVFRVVDGALELTEIAPGIDLERDILQQMGFRSRIATELKTMDTRLFSPQPMGLHREMAAKTRQRHPHLAQLPPQAAL